MSFKIDTHSGRWGTIENKPEALKGCLPYVRDEKARSLTKSSDNTVYYNIDKGAMRCKFLQLSCTTLLTHTIGVVATVAFELFHALTLCYFDTAPYDSFKDRLIVVTLLMLHVLSTPIVLIALQAIAMIGIIAPECARGAYVVGETFIYRIAADMIECKGYRPLYHCLTLPLHTQRTVDRYDAYLKDRAAHPESSPTNLFLQ